VLVVHVGKAVCLLLGGGRFCGGGESAPADRSATPRDAARRNTNATHKRTHHQEPDPRLAAQDRPQVVVRLHRVRGAVLVERPRKHGDGLRQPDDTALHRWGRGSGVEGEHLVCLLPLLLAAAGVEDGEADAEVAGQPAAGAGGARGC